MTNINHWGIIKLHQTFQDARKLYFLLELAPNGELFTYMKNEGILDLEQGQFLTAEILSMIEHMGKRNISHRDLKPSNLLLDSNMRLKLADFGSSKEFKNEEEEKEKEEDITRQSGGTKKKQLRRMNTFVGTVEYMSPEIIKGTWRKNECDIWSLGIIVFKFFAEYFPYLGDFDEDTIQKIEEDPLEFPEDFPEDAQDLCKRLLQKDPKKRLGWGPEGSELDMFALKAHPFFDGIDFDNLKSWNSPLPVSTIIRSSIKTKIIEECK